MATIETTDDRVLGSRGARSLLAASVAAQACALVRYTMLARLLGPEQLGLAASLALTSAFFELLGDLGSDRFLVQDPRGGDPAVQAVAHLSQIGRGVAISTAFVLFSGFVAEFFRAPQLSSAIRILALAPLINGFAHLDYKRVQLDHDFRPEGVILLAGEFSSLIVTLFVVIVTHSFVAILYGMIARSAVLVIVSHVVARRKYVVAFVAEHARRLAKFSGPLLLNGPLLFLGMSGDRVIIGRQAGLDALGHYAAVLLLIFYPASMLARFIQTTSLPGLSASRSDPAKFDLALTRLGGQVVLCALMMAAGFALVAPTFVLVIFGAKFREAAIMVALVGVLQTSRFLVVWPTAVSLAAAESTNILIGNVARLVVVPTSILGHLLFGGLSGVVGGFAVGECIALVVATAATNLSIGAAVLSGFGRLSLFFCASVVIVGWADAADHPSTPSILALSAASIALASWLYKTEREQRRLNCWMSPCALSTCPSPHSPLGNARAGPAPYE